MKIKMVRVPSRSGMKPVTKNPHVCKKQNCSAGGGTREGDGMDNSLLLRSVANSGTSVEGMSSENFWSRTGTSRMLGSATAALLGTSQMDLQVDSFENEFKQELSGPTHAWGANSENDILRANPEEYLLFNCKDQPITQEPKISALSMRINTTSELSAGPRIPASYAEFKREHGAIFSTQISYRAHRLNILKIELEKQPLTVSQTIDSPTTVKISPILRPRTSPASCNLKSRSSQTCSPRPKTAGMGSAYRARLGKKWDLPPVK